MYNPHDIYRTKVKTANGFTLSELLVVILIVAILASVALPLMHAKIDSVKWSEANAAAGTIRTAISTYTVHHPTAESQSAFIGKKLSDSTTQQALGFTDADLTGTYFVPSDYEITSIDAIGHATVKVTASQDNAPKGVRTLKTDGQWQ